MVFARRILLRNTHITINVYLEVIKMGLYEEWFKKAYTKDGKANNALWDDYLPKEQKIYEYILEEKVDKIEGTIGELAKKFSMSEEYIAGFIDGINETQSPAISLENLSTDTNVTVNIDFEKLYRQMVEYKADHLYNLPQWDNIFTAEQRKVFYKNQKSSKTYIREKKIGRNDPCPCGSGKKYKKCCGAN